MLCSIMDLRVKKCLKGPVLHAGMDLRVKKCLKGPVLHAGMGLRVKKCLKGPALHAGMDLRLKEHLKDPLLYDEMKCLRIIYCGVLQPDFFTMYTLEFLLSVQPFDKIHRWNHEYLSLGVTQLTPTSPSKGSIKGTNLYQIPLWISNIAGSLSPRLSLWCQNRSCSLADSLIIFFIDLFKGFNI